MLSGICHYTGGIKCNFSPIHRYMLANISSQHSSRSTSCLSPGTALRKNIPLASNPQYIHPDSSYLHIASRNPSDWAQRAGYKCQRSASLLMDWYGLPQISSLLFWQSFWQMKSEKVNSLFSITLFLSFQAVHLPSHQQASDPYGRKDNFFHSLFGLLLPPESAALLSQLLPGTPALI